LSAAAIHGDGIIGAGGGSSGGAGITAGQAGQAGRLVLGDSTTDVFGGAVTGASIIEMNAADLAYHGMRWFNQHIAGLNTRTPLIPGLNDGADILGLTGLSSDDAEFDAVRAGAPDFARAALVLMDTGPAALEQNWDGFDMLLMLNLWSRPLKSPQLGVGAEGYLQQLMRGGYARSPFFGGGGYEPIDELLPGEVYALLVPEGQTGFNLLAEGYDPGFAATMGDPLYIVPEPATLSLLALGGLAVLRRRRKL
jgi:hypothetical protein